MKTIKGTEMSARTQELIIENRKNEAAKRAGSCKLYECSTMRFVSEEELGIRYPEYRKIIIESLEAGDWNAVEVKPGLKVFAA